MPKEIHPLQKQLVETLKTEGFVRSEAVERAFLAVPRHLFLPRLGPDEAYKNENIPTKYSDAGEVISSASHPGIVADILEGLKLSAGQRVLEIGAGTGFNAALIAHLVGEEGMVVSLDYDEDTVEQARKHLESFGVKNVQVHHADGHFGFEALAPYDCIVMSTSSSDVYPAWVEQLREGGSLGFAVRFYSELGTFVIFEKKHDHLVSRAGARASFMPMRGAVTDTPSDEGEKLLRERIEAGKAFDRIFVYKTGADLPKRDQQIVLRRNHATFVFQWD